MASTRRFKFLPTNLLGGNSKLECNHQKCAVKTPQCGTICMLNMELARVERVLFMKKFFIQNFFAVANVLLTQQIYESGDACTPLLSATDRVWRGEKKMEHKKNKITVKFASTRKWSHASVYLLFCQMRYPQ